MVNANAHMATFLVSSLGTGVISTRLRRLFQIREVCLLNVRLGAPRGFAHYSGTFGQGWVPQLPEMVRRDD